MKETLESKKIGVAIGSGGVYAAAGLGVLQELEQQGINVPIVGGASGGALIAALYFLEGDAKLAEEKLIQKLPLVNNIKLSPFGKPMPGEKVNEIVESFLDGRDWNDGKLEDICFGAAYVDTHDPFLITRKTGLSLTNAVLASISLKMIDPVVSLDSRKIAHGGDPQYIKGIKALGADFIIEVSPNVETGTVGKLARGANALSSALILKGDYLATRHVKPPDKADLRIQPNLSVRPFISPLNFSQRNVELMIVKGRELTKKVLL